jgi:hypothetical protein
VKEVTTEERIQTLADMQKTAEKVKGWPLWRQAVLGTKHFTDAELKAYKAGKSYVDSEDPRS